MNLKTQLQPAWSHILIILSFVILSALFFLPVLTGNDLPQHDSIQAKGMARELVEYKEQTGKDAMWTNSMFGGMPAYQIRGGTSHSIYYYLNKVAKLFLPHFSIGILFIYMLGFYVFLISLNTNKWLAMAGALAFALATYNIIIIEAGHITKAYAIGFMAPVVAGVLLTFRRKYICGGLLTMFALGMQIASNHPQISYYLGLLLLVLFIVEFIYSLKDKTLIHFGKVTGITIFAAILAVLPNITNLAVTYEYGKESTRGKSELTDDAENKTSGLDKDYILNDYSYGINETMNLFIPNFLGGSSMGALSTDSETYKALEDNAVPGRNEIIKQLPLYWGEQRITSGPAYMGAIIIFLFIFGLLIVRGKIKWWLLAATLLSIFLAWGKNMMWFSDFMIDYFPLYNKFRAVSMALVIAGISVPLMAFLAIKEIYQAENKSNYLEAFKISIGISAGLALIFAIVGPYMFNFASSSDSSYLPEWLLLPIQHDRASLLRSDSIRTLIFVLLAGASVWLFLTQKLKAKYFAPVLIALILIDMWTVDKRHLNDEDFKPKQQANEIPLTDVDDFILKDSGVYRVFNLTRSPFNEALTSYFHHSIGGYHGAKLKRYQEIISKHIAYNNMNVLNMLNTRYVIIPGEDNKPVVQPNAVACGNAWFVPKYKIVENADEEINAITNFNPDSIAFIDKRFSSLLEKLPTENPTDSSNFSLIKLASYAPDHLIYQVNTKKDELAVFSEIYYDKGWNAYINNKPAPHFRTNYILRGMVLPKGVYMLEFKFEPKTYYVSQKISLATSILVVILLMFFVGKYMIRKEPETKK